MHTVAVTTVRPLMLITCAALLAACAGRTRVYEGEYQHGFERTTLRACGVERGDSPWWAVVSPKASAQAESLLVADRPDPVHVRVRARISDRGRYGHLGASSRIVSVVEVLELRPRREGDCTPLGARLAW